MTASQIVDSVLTELEDLSWNTEDFEEIEELEETKNELKTSLSRTVKLLIHDWLKYKAARCIQRYVRGWLCRTIYRRKRLAAVKIQTEWRRFYCQHKFYLKLEQLLQKRIEEHFYLAAQKIQALWRGWWVRQHIHDHASLVNMHLLAGEELLYCVAFKLHHLLRTHHIPGIYSLKNSTTYSKVEKLLASLKYKTHNQISIQLKRQQENETSEAKKQHKKSTYGTKIPFPANDSNQAWSYKCTPLYNAKDTDRRMSLILKMYAEADNDVPIQRLTRKKAKCLKQLAKIFNQPSTFCGDVITSMKKWKIIKDKNLTVDKNIFKTPENVESFLNEMASKLSLLEGDYFFRRKFLDDLDGKKAKHATESLSRDNRKESEKSLKKAQISLFKVTSGKVESTFAKNDRTRKCNERNSYQNAIFYCINYKHNKY